MAYYYSHHPYYGVQWPHAWSYSGFYPAYPAYERPCLCGGSGSSGGGRQEDRQRPDLRDYGGNPHVINIEKAAEWNTDFRRAIWTGRHLQVVLMSIEPGSDIGLEVPFEGALVEAMVGALEKHDPGVPVLPYLLGAGTDNKALATIGITGYGFAPLKLPRELDFTGMFHGVDERVPLDALVFGQRVLTDLIRTY